jgi:pimeloyl-ACP methyl ester carboxylesterase
VQRLRHDLSLVLLDGSGHCPHDEHPAAFNSALLGWLEQLPAQESGSGVGQ